MASDRPTQLDGRGEEIALAHLQRRGFRLLERHQRTPHGELDLIVFDGRTLVFVAVTTGPRGADGERRILGPAKQRQVRRTAREWLARVPHPRASELRLDAIEITLDATGRLARLEHLEGAF